MDEVLLSNKAVRLTIYWMLTVKEVARSLLTKNLALGLMYFSDNPSGTLGKSHKQLMVFHL